MPAFRNVVQFTAVSSGQGNFVVSAATAGHDTPQNRGAVDGKSYHYYAENADGTIWEQGDGAWNQATSTLARTTVSGNSSGTVAKINFAAPPIVSVFPSPPLGLEIAAAQAMIPSGTLMLFQQTAAPTGWTKQTTHNDKALRVVSGTAGSGGTNSFSSMFASRTSDAFTLDTTRIPAHQHSDLYGLLASGNVNPIVVSAGSDYQFSTPSTNTGATGGGGSHAHTYDMRVQYVDLIIATKDAYAT